MDKRKNAKLNVETSLLGFGAMRLACKKDGSIDYETSQKMVDLAIAGGVNYFDTAYVYHGRKSEEFLGDALVSRHPRESFYLATKLPAFDIHSADRIEPIFEEQLKKLKTDYIDFYLIHSIDWPTWERMKKLGVAAFIDKIKKAGKIRHIGFSSHANPEGYGKIVKDYPWEFTQLQINYADWDGQDAKKTYALAEEAGVPLVVMEPIRGGNLANPDSPPIKRLLAKLPAGTTPASVALRWVAGLSNVFVILSGMSLPEQVEENLKTFSPYKPLGPAELAAIADAQNALKELPIIPCTSCEYCDGCPQEIDIPQMFSKYNGWLAYENKGNFLGGYPAEGHRPSDCIACGKCSAVCPQHIEIPEKLKLVTAVYEKIAG